MNHFEEEAEETLHASLSDVLRGAIETGHLEPQVGAEMARVLAADAQARADVRTLDDAATTETYWKTVPAKGGRWRCTRMVWRGDEYGEDWLPAEELDGPTPDAARHAAAEWVRGQKDREWDASAMTNSPRRKP